MPPRPWTRSPVSNSSSAVTYLLLHHQPADTALLPATSVCFPVAFPASCLLLRPVHAALRPRSSTLGPPSARPEPKRSKGQHLIDRPVTCGQSAVTRSCWAEPSGQATSAATFGTDPGSSRLCSGGAGPPSLRNPSTGAVGAAGTQKTLSGGTVSAWPLARPVWGNAESAMNRHSCPSRPAPTICEFFLAACPHHPQLGGSRQFETCPSEDPLSRL